MHTEYQMRLVGDLCSFINGNGFSEKQWALEGLPIIRIQNLNGSNKFNYFDGQTKESWIIEPGDLLFAWAGVKGVSFGPCIWNGPRGVLNQHIYKVVASNEVDRNWLYAALKMVTERIESNAHGFKTSLVHVHKKDITSQVIYVPNLGEQKVIAATLSKWDEAIGKTGKLIELKESFFQSLLSSKILNKTFRRRKLGTMIYEISQRNQKGALRVLSVTNHRGFVLPEDQFERRVASQNLDNYKVVCKGQFAYNPSRINVGSIARLDNWETGVLSPMYVVFGVYENVIHSDFLFYWLQANETRKRIRAAAQGSVRESVNFSAFANLTIPLPEMNIQKEIVSQLNNTKDEINILKKIKKNLNLQKQALMQKLLTGKWRVDFKEEKNNE